MVLRERRSQAKNQIGAATVSSIISECRQALPDIDLLREVAVNLGRNRLGLGDFVSSIRLRTKMAEWGVAENAKIEDLIEAVNVYCFRAELPPGNFLNMVHKVASKANLSNTYVDRLPSKILKEQRRLKSYQNRVQLIRKLAENTLSEYRAISNDITDYKNNKPLLIRENRRLKLENEILKKMLLP